MHCLFYLSYLLPNLLSARKNTLEEQITKLPLETKNTIFSFLNFETITGLHPDELKSKRNEILEYRNLFGHQFTIKLWCAVCGLPISKQDGDPIFTIGKNIVHHKTCFTD